MANVSVLVTCFLRSSVCFLVCLTSKLHTITYLLYAELTTPFKPQPFQLMKPRNSLAIIKAQMFKSARLTWTLCHKIFFLLLQLHKCICVTISNVTWCKLFGNNSVKYLSSLCKSSKNPLNICTLAQAKNNSVPFL